MKLLSPFSVPLCLCGEFFSEFRGRPFFSPPFVHLRPFVRFVFNPRLTLSSLFRILPRPRTGFLRPFPEPSPSCPHTHLASVSIPQSNCEISKNWVCFAIFIFSSPVFLFRKARNWVCFVISLFPLTIHPWTLPATRLTSNWVCFVIFKCFAHL